MMFNTCKTLEVDAGRPLQLSLSARVLEGSGLALVTCLALVANLLLWVVILVYQPLCSVVNIFLLSLSAADFLEVVLSVFDTHIVVMDRMFSSCVVCKFMAFTSSLLEFVSITSLCVLATNRYVRICQPIYYPTLYSRTSVALHILAQWTLATLWASMPLVGWGQYEYIPYLFLCSMRTEDSKPLRIAGRVAFGIMILVIICCYIAIFYRLSKEGAVWRIESLVASASQGGQIRKRSAVPSIRNMPLLYAIRKLSAIMEVTDSEITNDVVSKCSYRTKTNGGTLTLASSFSVPESNTTNTGTNEWTLGHKDVRPEKDKEGESKSLPAHMARRVFKCKQSLDVFSSDSSVDMADQKKFWYERRFAQSLFVVTLIYFFSILPNFSLNKLNQSNGAPPTWKVACLLLGHLDTVLNPLLYVWGNSRIRAGYKQILKRCLKCWHCKGSTQVEPR